MMMIHQENAVPLFTAGAFVAKHKQEIKPAHGCGYDGHMDQTGHDS